MSDYKHFTVDNVNPKPDGFELVSTRVSRQVKDEDKTKLWHWLNLRETFCDGQVWPYRVEFLNKPSHGTFEAGELTNHHGPLLSANGIVTAREDNYRDLVYFYGSYVLSFRLMRPARLQFWLGDDGEFTVQFDMYVVAWFVPIWRLLAEKFWGRFMSWSARAPMSLPHHTA